MKTRAKQIWEKMSNQEQEKALLYYCNLAQQVHHNCEHGGNDFIEMDQEASAFSEGQAAYWEMRRQK